MMKYTLACIAAAAAAGAVTAWLILRGRKLNKAQLVKRLLPLVALLTVLALDAWGIAWMLPRAKETVTVQPVAPVTGIHEGAFFSLIDLEEQGQRQSKTADLTGLWMKKARGYLLPADVSMQMTGELPALEVKVPVGQNRILRFETGPDAVPCVITMGDWSAWLDCTAPGSAEASVFLPDPDAVNLQHIQRTRFAGYVLLLVLFDVLVLFGVRRVKKSFEKPAPSNGKNTAMELYRFLFALVIMLYHCQLVPGLNGYVMVEFFFILSGWMLMAHFDRMAARGCASPVEYIAGRLKRIWPYFLFFICFTYLARPAVFAGESLLKVITDDVGELFILQGFGIGTNYKIGFSSWYIACMLPAGFVIYALLCKNRKSFIQVIGPFAALTALGYLCSKYGTINHTEVYTGPGELLSRGFWRAFAEMSLGCVLFDLCRGRREKVTASGRAWASVLELGAFSLLLVFVAVLGDGYTMEISAIIVMLLLVASVMTGDSYLARAMSGKVSAYLGSLSLAMYLSHGLFQLLLLERFPDIQFVPLYLLSTAVTLVFSAVTVPLVAFIIKQLPRLFRALRY